MYACRSSQDRINREKEAEERLRQQQNQNQDDEEQVDALTALVMDLLIGNDDDDDKDNSSDADRPIRRPPRILRTYISPYDDSQPRLTSIDGMGDLSTESQQMLTKHLKSLDKTKIQLTADQKKKIKSWASLGLSRIGGMDDLPRVPETKVDEYLGLQDKVAMRRANKHWYRKLNSSRRQVVPDDDESKGVSLGTLPRDPQTEINSYLRVDDRVATRQLNKNWYRNLNLLGLSVRYTQDGSLIIDGVERAEDVHASQLNTLLPGVIDNGITEWIVGFEQENKDYFPDFYRSNSLWSVTVEIPPSWDASTLESDFITIHLRFGPSVTRFAVRTVRGSVNERDVLVILETLRRHRGIHRLDLKTIDDGEVYANEQDTDVIPSPTKVGTFTQVDHMEIGMGVYGTLTHRLLSLFAPSYLSIDQEEPMDDNSGIQVPVLHNSLFARNVQVLFSEFAIDINYLAYAPKLRAYYGMYTDFGGNWYIKDDDQNAPRILPELEVMSVHIITFSEPDTEAFGESHDEKIVERLVAQAASFMPKLRELSITFIPDDAETGLLPYTYGDSSHRNQSGNTFRLLVVGESYANVQENNIEQLGYQKMYDDSIAFYNTIKAPTSGVGGLSHIAGPGDLPPPPPPPPPPNLGNLPRDPQRGINEYLGVDDRIVARQLNKNWKRKLDLSDMRVVYNEFGNLFVNGDLKARSVPASQLDMLRPGIIDNDITEWEALFDRRHAVYHPDFSHSNSLQSVTVMIPVRWESDAVHNEYRTIYERIGMHVTRFVVKDVRHSIGWREAPVIVQTLSHHNHIHRLDLESSVLRYALVAEDVSQQADVDIVPSYEEVGTIAQISHMELSSAYVGASTQRLLDLFAPSYLALREVAQVFRNNGPRITIAVQNQLFVRNVQVLFSHATMSIDRLRLVPNLRGYYGLYTDSPIDDDDDEDTTTRNLAELEIMTIQIRAHPTSEINQLVEDAADSMPKLRELNVTFMHDGLEELEHSYIDLTHRNKSGQTYQLQVSIKTYHSMFEPSYRHAQKMYEESLVFYNQLQPPPPPPPD